MSLRRYQYFLVVAEEGNVQRAAQRLFISQQALSAHIQRLEEEYGVLLFERRPRFRLTPAGEQMVLHCRRLMEVHERMSADLSELRHCPQEKIVVGASPLRAQIFLPRIWDLLNPLYPNISIAARDVSSLDMEEELIRERIDIFIGVNSSRIASLQYLPLAAEPLCCVAKKSLLNQYGVTAIDGLLEDSKIRFDLKRFLHLAQFPYVFPPQNNRLRLNIDRYFYEAGVVPQVVFEGSNRLIWNMCYRGCGVGFLTPTLLYDSMISGKYNQDMCIFPIYDASLVSNVDAVYLKSRPLSAAFQTLVEITQEVFQAYVRTVLGQNGTLSPSKTGGT